MKLTVKYFSNSVNIISWELRTDACLCNSEAKVIRLMTMVLLTILMLVYDKTVVVVHLFTISKVQDSFEIA